MVRITKEERQIRADRDATQHWILETFGQDNIKKATERLCAHCYRTPCLLFPITSKGEDCPYFWLRETEK